MLQPYAGALAALREFNYERIYTRPSSVAQGRAVVAVLSALVEYFASDPARVPSHHRVGGDDEKLSGEELAVRQAVTYVSGMTDRFAFTTAVELLGWRPERLPRGIDSSWG